MLYIITWWDAVIWINAELGLTVYSVLLMYPNCCLNSVLLFFPDSYVNTIFLSIPTAAPVPGVVLLIVICCPWCPLSTENCCHDPMCFSYLAYILQHQLAAKQGSQLHIFYSLLKRMYEFRHLMGLSRTRVNQHEKGEWSSRSSGFD